MPFHNALSVEYHIVITKTLSAYCAGNADCQRSRRIISVVFVVWQTVKPTIPLWFQVALCVKRVGDNSVLVRLEVKAGALNGVWSHLVVSHFHMCWVYGIGL